MTPLASYYRSQVVALFAGAVFAWYTVVNDFLRFYDIEGTVFRIKDCVTMPNPVTTPCFWGAVGFIVALVWALKLTKSHSSVTPKKHSYFTLYLVACVIFGWTNFSLVLFRFLGNHGKPTIGCSGQITTNPFSTPCFWGSVFFLLSLLIAIYIWWYLRGQSKKSEIKSSPKT